MNNNKYNLFDFFETLKSDTEFNTIKKRINQNETPLINLLINTIDDKKIKVYSAEMFYLLKSNEYTNEGFIESYSIGFENGKKFIKQKNKRDLKGLYSSCPEKYIDELKVFYFDKAPNEILSYKQIATNYPIIFKVNEIEKIGFASGVINAIDLMAIENPILFENFYLQIKPPYSENIELYKNSASNFFIENCINNKNEDGTNNKLYYNNFLQKDFIAGLNDIDTNEAYTLFKDKAKEYIRTEKSLKINIIKYLIGCNKDQINVIQYHWYEKENNFISIKDFISAIDYYKVTNETLKAIKLKQYIVSKLKLIVRDLEFFHIYLTETPIEAKINNLITEFENSIDINEINQIEALKTQPQQVESIKPDEVIKEFKDFFIPDVKIETINNIQTNFKDLIGKKMAFLIYLLETEFKIINYSLNGKNDSRKHFVKSLKSIDTKMQGINKHFETNSTNLSIHKFENDNDYKKIKDFLTKTI